MKKVFKILKMILKGYLIWDVMVWAFIVFGRALHFANENPDITVLEIIDALWEEAIDSLNCFKLKEES